MNVNQSVRVRRLELESESNKTFSECGVKEEDTKKDRRRSSSFFSINSSSYFMSGKEKSEVVSSSSYLTGKFLPKKVSGSAG